MQGSSIINFELPSLEWKNLRRKRAFYSGVPLVLKSEYEAPDKLLDFNKLPDVLPIKPRIGFVDVNYNELIKNTMPEEETKDVED